MASPMTSHMPSVAAPFGLTFPIPNSDPQLGCVHVGLPRCNTRRLRSPVSASATATGRTLLLAARRAGERPLNFPRKPLIVGTKTFTLFVLSPGVENPAAQTGIDCSFCAKCHTPAPRSGPRQDCVSRKRASAADGSILVARPLSYSHAPASPQRRLGDRPRHLARRREARIGSRMCAARKRITGTATPSPAR